MYIVITGTSRGIGLELARQALAAKNTVLAVARDPEKSPELKALRAEHGDRLQVLAADLTNPEAPAKIHNAVKSWPAVDVLINNAGILRDKISTEDFLESFHVNSVVPFQITQTLLPQLRKSRSPKAVHITSQMGSIDDNSSGGYYPYRASKAALNMINKSLSVDNEWLNTIVMHPGWVKTDMGGASAPTAPSESAAGIWRVVSGLKTEDSGAFFDFRGKHLPW